eukprot:m.189735 g.189735  ORF g.189735 m.189735 type:complete len:586 (+) comp17815_c0_seq1:296-2053(+)
MGNAVTIQSREKKNNARFELPVHNDNVQGHTHYEEQCLSVQKVIGARVIASRWRRKAHEHALQHNGGGPPGSAGSRGKGLVPKCRSNTAHVATEIYSGGMRTSVFARNGRIKALTKLGDYTILKKLGEGSFAQVKLAQHEPTGQKVAIKLFDKTKKLSSYEMKHFYREATVLQRVQSVHCAAAYQFLDADFVYALVFELIKTDLLDDVTTNGPYSEDKARITIRQVVSGIEAVHAVDLVHRDLKLENIGVTHSGVVKLLDFGLAGDIRGKDGLDTQCGTMVYSAPELLGESVYGKQVDIWSIGIVLFSLLYARLPYEASVGRALSLTQLHAMMLDHDYKLPDTTPESLRELFRRLLEVRPSRRITCEQLWQDPWILNQREGQTPLPPITLAETSTAVTEASIDMDIVKALVSSFSKPVDSVVDSVVRNKCDPICGTYHMRVRRKSNLITGHMEPSPIKSRIPDQPAVKKRTSVMDTLLNVFKRTSVEKSAKNGKKSASRVVRKAATSTAASTRNNNSNRNRSSGARVRKAATGLPTIPRNTCAKGQIVPPTKAARSSRFSSGAKRRLSPGETAARAVRKRQVQPR